MSYNNYETDDEYDYEQEEEEIVLHPTEGKYIINAVTGGQTKYLVGSKYESLFWKMLDVSLSSYIPIPKKIMGPARGGKTFFFFSPEDYESIYEKTLDESIKIAWRQKRMRV